MTIHPFIGQIKQHLGRNELKTALEAVGKVLRLSKSAFENDHILLSNRFHQLNADMRSGIINYSTAGQSQMQLVQAFTAMLDELHTDVPFLEYMGKMETETLHRGGNQVDDLLQQTLKRHQHNQEREAKRWFMENQAGVKVLEISTTDQKPQGAFLSKKDRITFGRSPDSDIIIYDPYFGRRHAELSCQGNEIWLSDFQSKNGTYFNNHSIKKMKIESSGELRLDQTFFQIRFLVQ